MSTQHLPATAQAVVTGWQESKCYQKKRVFSAVLILCLLLVAGCPVLVPTPEEAGEPPPVVEPIPRQPEEPPPVVEPLPRQPVEEITTVFSEIKEGLKLQLSLPTVSYRPGEILTATLSLINTAPDEISLSTRTSQLFDFVIKGAGLSREVTWSEDKMFLQVITPHYIPAGGKLSDLLSWEIDLSPGEFYLTGVTVLFDLNGERIRLRTDPLSITVE